MQRRPMAAIHRITVGARIVAGIVAIAAAAAASAAAGAPVTAPAGAAQRTTNVIAGVSVPFVENAGSADGGIRFVAPMSSGTLLVTREGDLEYALRAPRAGPRSGLGGTHSNANSTVFGETFIGGNGRPQAGSRHNAHVSRFTGADARQNGAAVPTYAEVLLGEVFDGIDVRLRATGRNVEKIFTVAPARDPARIRIAVRGAESIGLADDGRLLVHLADGDVAFTAPIAYQMIDGARVDVPVSYTLAAAGEYGFRVGEYDHRQPLVIDPLLQSTYLGGGSDETITAMAVHPVSGEVIVTGFTTSGDLTCPAGGCAGAFAHTAGARDGFVARFDPTLTTLLQLTYLGGTGNDQINALAIHPATGEIVVAGNTNSPDFPCTSPARGCAGGGQPDFAGGAGDGFVARLNPTLTALLQASYIGGTGTDEVNAVAVNPVNGEILVAGSTDSGDLPCTSFASGCGAGPQPQIAGGEDGFVARFNPSLTALVRATYFGGATVDRIFGLAVHPNSGEVVIAGQSQSNDLPCTKKSATCATAAQPDIGGGIDGFVARLSGNLGKLLQTTYVGTPGADNIFALAIHPSSGEIYVAGTTASSAFPCVSVGDGCASGGQTTVTAGQNGFVLRLDAHLTRRLQASYVGGSGFDVINALAIHPATGEVFVAGQTESADLPCAVAGGVCANGAQAQSGGGFDGFVTRLDGALTLMLQSTYFGGGGIEDVAALALHPQSGEVLIAGNSSSTDLPCTSLAGGCGAGVQPQLAGGSLDSFVARISADLTAADAMPDAMTFALRSGVPPSTVVTSSPVRVTGIAGAAVVYVDGALGSAYCIASTAQCGCDVAGFSTSRGSVADGQFVCVRHVTAPIADELARTTLHVGGGAAIFRSITGNAFAPVAGCSLDVDGNNAVDALTDGMLILRAMMGFTGTAVTGGAVGNGATRGDWNAIRAYLNGSCGMGFQP